MGHDDSVLWQAADGLYSVQILRHRVYVRLHAPSFCFGAETEQHVELCKDHLDDVLRLLKKARKKLRAFDAEELRQSGKAPAWLTDGLPEPEVEPVPGWILEQYQD